MVATNQTRLGRLMTQRDQIDAQIADLNARERQRNRKRETRRKIILGAVLAKHLARNPDSPWMAELLDELDRFVTRPGDRQLLDLPPLNTAAMPADTARIGKKKPSLRDGIVILKR